MTDWLTEYVNYALDSESPTKMLYWAGVSAVAGALRRNVWIDQGRYTLYPNFFIVFVARPGVVQKTTTLNHAQKLLKKLPAIKFAPKNTTWEGFIAFLEEQHSASHGLLTAFGAQDGEVNLDAEVVRTAAVMIQSGEFSLFYDPEDQGMISALTDLWDCPEDFEKMTKFSGSEYIDNPCINLVAATTPSFMARGFDRFSREGGLASRIIFVHATTKRQRVAHPAKANKRQGDALVNGLEKISKLHGEITLTPEALVRSKAWYEEHCDAMEKGGVLASTGFQDRKQTHILKLAMVISCVRRADYRITLEDLEESITRINEVEGDFLSAFESLDEREDLRPYKEVRAFVKNAGTVTRPALLAKFTHKFLLMELDRALNALVADGSIGIGAGLSGSYYKWKGEA